MYATKKNIQQAGLSACCKQKNFVSVDSIERYYKSIYGVSVAMATLIWNTLVEQELLPDKAQYKHMFWSLSFIKVYSFESVFVELFNTSDKTFRKWVWEFLKRISVLNIVSTIDPYVLQMICT
jgi:hypothetical protein